MPADAATKGVRDFRTQFPQAWGNLLNDSALEEAEKETFYRYLEAYKTGDLEGYCKTFFRQPGKKFQGSNIPLAPGEQLGTVRTHGALISALTGILKYTADQAEALLESLVELEEAEQIEEIATVIGNQPYASFLVWSFRNPAGDLYAGIDPHFLPCILGLPSYGTARHYTFGHELASTPQLPTFFDAETFDQWRPGGATLSHAACRSTYPRGLPEVVHRPNSFTDIKTKIFEV